MSAELSYFDRTNTGLSTFYVLLFQGSSVANGGGLTDIEFTWDNATVRANVIQLIDTNHVGIYLGDMLEGVPAGTYTPVVFQSSGDPATTATTTDALIERLEPINWTGEAVRDAGATVAEIVTSLASTIPINVISPATPTHLDIVRGDSYVSTEGAGRTLSFTYLGNEPWPDTISSALFTCKPTPETLRNYTNAASLADLACVVDVATGSGRKVTVNLTGSNTATLQASLDGTNNYRWWINANGTNAGATLRMGTMTVRPNPSAV